MNIYSIEMGYFRIGSLKIINEPNGIKKIIPRLLGRNFGYGYNFSVEEETEYEIKSGINKYKGNLRMEIDDEEMDYAENRIYKTKNQKLLIKIYIRNAQMGDYLYLRNISIRKHETTPKEAHPNINRINVQPTTIEKIKEENTHERVLTGISIDFVAEGREEPDLEPTKVLLDTLESSEERLENPKISIILPTYNGQKYLREALNSIVNQTYDDFELIIVDDGTTTYNIKDVLSEIGDKRIILLKNEINRGTPYALNKGFAYSRGELLTWTSDDNELHLDFLEKFVERFEKNPHIDFLYCFHINYHWNGRKIGMCRPYANREDFLLAWRGMAGFMWRRRVYERIGDFDQNLFGIDDWDYALRIVFSGFNYSHIPKVLYKYRNHKRNISHKLATQKKFGDLENKLLKKIVANPNVVEYFEGMNKNQIDNFINKAINKRQKECVRIIMLEFLYGLQNK